MWMWVLLLLCFNIHKGKMSFHFPMNNVFNVRELHYTRVWTWNGRAFTFSFVPFPLFYFHFLLSHTFTWNSPFFPPFFLFYFPSSTLFQVTLTFFPSDTKANRDSLKVRSKVCPCTIQWMLSSFSTRQKIHCIPSLGESALWWKVGGDAHATFPLFIQSWFWF